MAALRPSCVRLAAARPSVHLVPKRAHSGEMFVTGLVRTVNFGFFSGTVPSQVFTSFPFVLVPSP